LVKDNLFKDRIQTFFFSSRQQATELAGSKISSLRKQRLKLKVGFQVNRSLFSKGLRLKFFTSSAALSTGLPGYRLLAVVEAVFISKQLTSGIDRV